jgi:hypothetical protein
MVPSVKPLIMSGVFTDNTGLSIEKPLIMSGFRRARRGYHAAVWVCFAFRPFQNVLTTGTRIKLALFGIFPLYI